MEEITLSSHSTLKSTLIRILIGLITLIWVIGIISGTIYSAFIVEFYQTKYNSNISFILSVIAEFLAFPSCIIMAIISQFMPLRWIPVYISFLEISGQSYSVLSGLIDGVDSMISLFIGRFIALFCNGFLYITILLLILKWYRWKWICTIASLVQLFSFLALMLALMITDIVQIVSNESAMAYIWTKWTLSIVSLIAALSLTGIDKIVGKSKAVIEFSTVEFLGLGEIKRFPLLYWLLFVEYLCYNFYIDSLPFHIELNLNDKCDQDSIIPRLAYMLNSVIPVISVLFVGIFNDYFGRLSFTLCLIVIIMLIVLILMPFGCYCNFIASILNSFNNALFSPTLNPAILIILEDQRLLPIAFGLMMSVGYLVSDLSLAITVPLLYFGMNLTLYLVEYIVLIIMAISTISLVYLDYSGLRKISANGKTIRTKTQNRIDFLFGKSDFEDSHPRVEID